MTTTTFTIDLDPNVGDEVANVAVDGATRYAITDGAGKDFFTIDSGGIITIADIEARSSLFSYTLTVAVTDSQRNVTTRTVTISNPQAGNDPDGTNFQLGTSGMDTTYGYGGADLIYGNNSNDVLYGGSGDDFLHGDNGDDTLYGGIGNDQLTGGDDADIFVLNTDDTGTDTVTDFDVSDGDKIRLYVDTTTTLDTLADALRVAELRVGENTDQHTTIYKKAEDPNDDDHALMVLRNFSGTLTDQMFDVVALTLSASGANKVVENDDEADTGVILTVNNNNTELDVTNFVVSDNNFTENDFEIVKYGDNWKLKIKDGDGLDYEKAKVHHLTIEVSDGVGRKASIEVTVEVGDVNEFAPTFSETSYEFTVPEGTAINTVISDDAFKANDADADAYDDDGISLRYESNTSLFAPKSMTGAIYLLHALNYETARTYDLMISAYDDGNVVTVPVTINVSDVNEFAPTFSKTSYEFTVSEYANIGDVISDADFKASDVDADAYDDDDISLTYSITEGNDLDIFAIDGTTGEISLNDSGYETSPLTHELTVQVTDSSPGQTGRTATATVRIIDTAYRGSGERDTITGTPEANVAHGRGGNDRLFGYAGDDALYGGADNDFLYGGADDDALYGDEGDDRLYGDAGDDTLTGGAGNDILVGGDDADIFVLNAGIISETDADIVEDFDAAEDDVIRVEFDDTGLATVATVADLFATANLRVEKEHTTLTGYSTRSADSATTKNTTIYNNDVLIMVLEDFASDLTIDMIDIRIVDTPGNDSIITGSAFKDTINGGDGDDTLDGGGGKDILIGGSGADTFVFDADITSLADADIVEDFNPNDGDKIRMELDGIDLTTVTSRSTLFSVANIRSGWTHAKLLGQRDADSASIFNTAIYNGNTVVMVLEDFISSLTIDMFEIVLRGTDDDNAVLNGSDFGDTIYGYAGHDHLYGREGDDTLYGGEDGDDLSGGKGADALYGGDGNDEIHGGMGDDTLYGGEGDDILNGGVEGYGADILYGGAGDDKLYGHGGDDILEGGEGADTLSGGSGDDTLTGGAGNDLFYLTDRDSVVADFRSDGDDRLFVSASVNAESISTIDDLKEAMNIRLETAHKNVEGLDRSLGDDSSIKNTIIYKVKGADDSKSTETDDVILFVLEDFTSDLTLEMFTFPVSGTDQDDAAINGRAINDTIFGYTGNDRLYGYDGADILYGGEGYDYLSGHDGADALYGGEGNDNLRGGRGADVMYGGQGDDDIRGGSGADTLYGGEGNDVLLGHGNADALYGGAGVDFLWGGSGADSFVIDLASAISSPRTVGENTEDTDIVVDFESGDRIRIDTTGVDVGDNPSLSDLNISIDSSANKKIPGRDTTHNESGKMDTVIYYNNIVLMIIEDHPFDDISFASVVDIA